MKRFILSLLTFMLQIFVYDNRGGEDISRIDKIDIFGSLEGATAPLTGLRSTDDD